MTSQLTLTTQEPQRAPGRHEQDFYATPGWCVRLLLDAYTPAALCAGVIDPACGDGAILDVVADMYPGDARRGVELDTRRAEEARRRGHPVITSDFVHDWQGRDAAPVWYLGNPPYKLAQEFVERALAIAPGGSEVTYLLRLAFLASQRRAPLFAPGAGFAHLHVLPRRPSFTPDGRTDQYDYGWFTWRKGWAGPATISHLAAPAAVVRGKVRGER